MPFVCLDCFQVGRGVLREGSLGRARPGVYVSSQRYHSLGSYLPLVVFSCDDQPCSLPWFSSSFAFLCTDVCDRLC